MIKALTLLTILTTAYAFADSIETMNQATTAKHQHVVGIRD